jgi:hypothetical protein
MRTPFRSLLGLSVLAVIVAACGTTAGTPAESTPSAPSSQAPSMSPDASPELAGTITIVNAGAVDGPGESIADALAAARTEPTLVNGVIYKDTDGTIYLADSLTDAAAPTFGDPTLEVLDYPDNEADWDMANADLIGLQEANGVVFRENAQLYGVVAP